MLVRDAESKDVEDQVQIASTEVEAKALHAIVSLVMYISQTICMMKSLITERKKKTHSGFTKILNVLKCENRLGPNCPRPPPPPRPTPRESTRRLGLGAPASESPEQAWRRAAASGSVAGGGDGKGDQESYRPRRRRRRRAVRDGHRERCCGPGDQDRSRRRRRRRRNTQARIAGCRHRDRECNHTSCTCAWVQAVTTKLACISSRDARAVGRDSDT
jgi:hypothetical protein